MGNICSAAGDYCQRVQSVSDSISISAANNQLNFRARTQSAQQLTLLYPLSEQEQQRFLRIDDPLQLILGGNADALVYRSTEKKTINNGMIKANLKSASNITLEQQLRTDWSKTPTIEFRGGLSVAEFVKHGRTLELKDPSLNLMSGVDAYYIANSFYQTRKYNKVAIQTGALLQKGGRVHCDSSTVAADTDTVQSLIVTLREQKKLASHRSSTEINLKVVWKTVLLVIGIQCLVVLVFNTPDLIERLISDAQF